MANRSVIVRIKAEVADYKRQMADAARATEEVGKKSQETAAMSTTAMGQLVQSASRHEEAWNTAGTALMGFGTIAVAGVGLAIAKYAAFDKAMSNVQAATHASVGEMEQLREAAIRAGADTAYSAEEAAGAVEELAKAGVSTADILSGGLAGALSLAAAGELEVGKAAELAATAMTQFGLKGAEIPHIADLLAAGAGKAQGSVEDMGMALKQAGLVANQTGLTIEETTGGLAAFAAAGLVGSDAGTSFKSMLQRLTPQSEAAATRMAELGISAYDAQGNFIGLEKFAGNLKESMSGLTVEQRNAAMATIFGSDAVRAASVLYEEGAKGIGEWIDKVDAAGYAAVTAAIKQDNLAGDLEKLSGAFDTVFLKAGSGANDALRSLVQTTEQFVDLIGTIPAPVLSAVAGITGIAGAAALVGGAFMVGLPKYLEARSAFKEIAVSSPNAARGVSRLAKAAGAAGAALIGLQVLGAISKSMGESAASTAEMGQALLSINDNTDAIDKAFENIGGLGTQIHGVGDALERWNNRTWYDELNNFLGDFVGGTSKMQELRDNIATLDSTIAGMVGSGSLDAAAQAFKRLVAAGEENNVTMEETAAMMPQYKASLQEVASNLGVQVSKQEMYNWMLGEVPPKVAAAQAAEEELAGALDTAAQATDAAKQALADMGIAMDGTIVKAGLLLDAMFAAGLATMSSRDANARYQESLSAMNAMIDDVKNGTINLGAALNGNKTDFDLTTKAGRSANATFQALAQGGMNRVQAMAEAGLGQDVLQTKLQGTYRDLISAAEGMGITGGKAVALARNVLGIPEGVNIETWMQDFANRKANQTREAVISIPKGVDVDTFMSDKSYRMSVLTKAGILDIPNHDRVSTYMENNTFVEALRQRAAILNIPAKDVVDSFMSSASRNEADKTTAAVLGIPKGSSVTSFMENDAKVEAWATRAAINDIPRNVTVNTYFNEYQTKYIKSVHQRVNAPDLNGSASGSGRPGMYTGGVVGFAGGGQVPGTPPADPTFDNIAAVTQHGTPYRIRSGEWIVNEDSSRENHHWLKAINNGLNLNEVFGKAPGLWGGERVGSAGMWGNAPSAPAKYGTHQTIVHNRYDFSFDVKTADPMAAANEAVDLIRWQFQKDGVRLGG